MKQIPTRHHVQAQEYLDTLVKPIWHQIDINPDAYNQVAMYLDLLITMFIEPNHPIILESKSEHQAWEDHLMALCKEKYGAPIVKEMDTFNPLAPRSKVINGPATQRVRSKEDFIQILDDIELRHGEADHLVDAMRLIIEDLIEDPAYEDPWKIMGDYKSEDTPAERYARAIKMVLMFNYDDIADMRNILKGLMIVHEDFTTELNEFTDKCFYTDGEKREKDEAKIKELEKDVAELRQHFLEVEEEMEREDDKVIHGTKGLPKWKTGDILVHKEYNDLEVIFGNWDNEENKPGEWGFNCMVLKSNMGHAIGSYLDNVSHEVYVLKA